MSLTCFNSSTISCKFPITSVRLSCKEFKDIRIQYSRFLFLKIRRFSEIFHDEKLSEVFLSDYLPISVTSIFCSVRMRKSLYSEKRALFQVFIFQSKKKTTWLMMLNIHSVKYWDLLTAFWPALKSRPLRPPQILNAITFFNAFKWMIITRNHLHMILTRETIWKHVHVFSIYFFFEKKLRNHENARSCYCNIYRTYCSIVKIKNNNRMIELEVYEEK